MYGPGSIDERFDDGLDTAVWVPAYLPAWSSRREAAATYDVDDRGLRLSLPPEHPRWCLEDHGEPLRVSGVQSGSWSGPVGSTRGQQPFLDGQVVREEQVAQWGYTPHRGTVAVRCSARIGPGSMFSAWMVGIEDEPERSGEICLVEVFGDTVEHDAGHGVSAAVGHGIHPFRDPSLHEEFSAPRTAIDVSTTHEYAVEWDADGVRFLIDGRLVRTSKQSPTYPMQLILAVFDFPAKRTAGDDHVPQLRVRSVRGEVGP